MNLDKLQVHRDTGNGHTTEGGSKSSWNTLNITLFGAVKNLNPQVIF